MNNDFSMHGYSIMLHPAIMDEMCATIQSWPHLDQFDRLKSKAFMAGYIKAKVDAGHLSKAEGTEINRKFDTFMVQFEG